MNKKRKQSGYALLFAVLTAVLVMGVAAFILGVAKKQYAISAIARDSMYSFYNADSAISCIEQSWNPSASNPSVTCDNKIISPTQSQSTSPLFSGNPTRYQGAIDFDTAGCALFNIWVGTDPVTNNPKTVIETRGYNVCGGNPLAPTATAVERAIRLTQQ
ncbi:hypothetical protein KGQ27_03070 [Patescibacteria group bacterium]|nr:hypothetical protein [Patescibacteria group bacterium]MDE1946748.1 hypothetical protein [Patescibacteria group bacterium]MDE2010949.1 hypothetical protein [Patescibacteria group bacterium]MDE2233562.1 hypothetical protein [Patescibacteria group bacterium]